ncbi:MAG: ribonuclease R [Rhodospirillales bacterium]
MAKRPRRPDTPPEPLTRERVKATIAASPVPLGKRELSRALGVTAAERPALRAILAELESDGALERGRGRRFGAPGALPEVSVLEVYALDRDGTPLARPAGRESGEAPAIHIVGEARGQAAAPGDRVLARIKRNRDGTFDARVMRRLESAPPTVLGVFRTGDKHGWIHATDRRIKHTFVVLPHDMHDAADGDIVRAEALPGKHLGLPKAKVVERLGALSDPKSASLVAIQAHGIPTEFPPEAQAQAAAAKPVPLGERTDLRAVPLVTIDDEDARDFDDAVWAAPDADPANPGGFELVVAIADVAHYVRPGDALDRTAKERGNSVYFPDRVVPMLPEALSNGLCSLKPDEDRGCLAVRMWVDADGNLRRHQFVRGLMRSAARLTYTQVQTAQDGSPDELTGPLREPVIAPLFAAYAVLRRAREERGALDIDRPERKVVLAPDGSIAAIVRRQRFDSHRLIEEFMILANVAAAETLEARRYPVMYRLHDRPTVEKVESLREFLSTLGIRVARGQAIEPRMFGRILERAAGTPHADVVSEAVLRSQAQAVYGPDNLGHFGLALRRYAHFTSPIRRYSDVLVHRALIGALRLGEGGIDRDVGEAFAATGAHISMTERRAAAAERTCLDRMTTAFLVDRAGATFPGRVSGVQRFGLFVTLDDIGADGLLPVSALGPDYYDYDERSQSLTGRAGGGTFRFGDRIVVRLDEANLMTGTLTFRRADVPAAVAHGRHRPPPRHRRR